MGNKQDFTAEKQLMIEYEYHMSRFHAKKVVHKVEDIKFPLSTANAAIVDSNGKRVRITGANWSGGHMARHCVDGL